MRPWIPISTMEFTPLFDLLKRGTLYKTITLEKTHQHILLKLQQAIDCSCLRCYDPSMSLFFYIFSRKSLITGLLAQGGEPIHWVHLSVGGAPWIYATLDHLGDCIIKGRELSNRLFGHQPHTLVVPFRLTNFE